MNTAIVLVGMFVLLALGTPVAFSMLIAGSLGLLLQGGPTVPVWRWDDPRRGDIVVFWSPMMTLARNDPGV